MRFQPSRVLADSPLRAARGHLFFLASLSFVLAFTLVLAIENEIPLTKPRSLTILKNIIKFLESKCNGV